jgi:two-component system OmpR family response regulator
MSDRPTILIVEDDEDCRMVLQDLLELNGFEVRTCADAHHAIAAVRAQPPALMLIDYLMPDGNGAWVVRTLREDGGAAARVPVVLTTGSNDGRQEADALGVRSVEKPFDINRLLEIVRTLVPKA